ncbi:adhesion G protein-coupled receptor E4-like [Gigantopelta aegis]|uniref:adhesion G protein-coupled receptor E4-like n=1 Tax=Gigantopelta aegis TaxID=1735272 RepID=UPI001B88A639|nr:adhesion G protein-coupled receptor E4-like [Gigantopelta aegis]
MVVFDENSASDICDQFITAMANEWAKFLASLKVCQYAMVFQQLSSNVKTNGQALSLVLQFKVRSNTSRKHFEEYLYGAFTDHWNITFNETQYRFSLSDFARHQYDIDYTKTFISYPSNGSCCHTIPGIANLPNSSMDSGFLIDITQVYFCASVKLNSSDFNWTDDGSVVLHYANVKLSTGKFYYYQKHEIFVCIEQLQNIYRTLLEPSDFDIAKKYISLICTLLSMACLMLTFFTFCTFPSLRTNASINTVHLVIFLFLAQGFLQFGLPASDNDVLCKVIGILIHYFWLSALLWMNVCSYQMFSVFVLDASKPINIITNRGRLTKYRIYANGTSAMIVAANVAFSLLDSEGAEIGYGIGRCYLSSYLRIAIAFVLPLALVVTSNIVFFVLSVCTISKISRLGESLNNGRENIVIYGKLSVFTGMFWIFALISEVSNEGRNILSLLSILLNATQGVFIFLSYTANRRVFELWKWKLTVRLPVRNQSRSTLNSTL